MRNNFLKMRSRAKPLICFCLVQCLEECFVVPSTLVMHASHKTSLNYNNSKYRGKIWAIPNPTLSGPTRMTFCIQMGTGVSRFITLHWLWGSKVTLILFPRTVTVWQIQMGTGVSRFNASLTVGRQQSNKHVWAVLMLHCLWGNKITIILCPWTMTTVEEKGESKRNQTVDARLYFQPTAWPLDQLNRLT